LKTFCFILWRPVISRFAQNVARHSCSSVFKASVGCPIFPGLDAQTVDARKPLPTTTTGHLRIATKAAGSDFVGLFAPCARSYCLGLDKPQTHHRPFLSHQVYPIGANRGPVPTDIPHNVSLDYIEACNVLPISAKASAALSRRCLQTMLHAAGYKAKDLSKEIDLLLNETDTRKALPHKLRETVDASEILETSLLIRSMTKPLYR
jgi:hypothetical protein